VYDGNVNEVQENVAVPPKVKDAEVVLAGGVEIHDVKVSAPLYWMEAGVKVRPRL
jgi:hypothetical protein